MFTYIIVKPLRSGEKACFSRKGQGKNIGFQEKSQGKFVLFRHKSGKFFSKSLYKPCKMSYCWGIVSAWLLIFHSKLQTSSFFCPPSTEKLNKSFKQTKNPDNSNMLNLIKNNTY